MSADAEAIKHLLQWRWPRLVSRSVACAPTWARARYGARAATLWTPRTNTRTNTRSTRSTLEPARSSVRNFLLYPSVPGLQSCVVRRSPSCVAGAEATSLSLIPAGSCQSGPESLVWTPQRSVCTYFLFPC